MYNKTAVRKMFYGQRQDRKKQRPAKFCGPLYDLHAGRMLCVYILNKGNIRNKKTCVRKSLRTQGKCLLHFIEGTERFFDDVFCCESE